MPAAFESGFFGGGKEAWHGLGTVIEEDVVEIGRALELAGLDWEVMECPLMADLQLQLERDESGQLTGKEIDRQVNGGGWRDAPFHKALVRDTDGEVLGVVGRDFHPVQNRTAFQFMDDLLDAGQAHVHTAGALLGGRRVWVLSRIPKDVLIAGEEVQSFLLVANGHDGSMALTCAVTPVRVVCNNTLQMALGGAARTWKGRHTSGLGGRLSEAKRTIELTYRYLDEFAQVGQGMAEQRMTRPEFDAFLDRLLPVNPAWDEDGRSRKNRDEQVEAIQAVYANSDNLGNVRGTAWGAWNAVAEWSDHVKPIRAGRRSTQVEMQFSRQLDQPELKERALALLAPESAAPSLVRKVGA